MKSPFLPLILLGALGACAAQTQPPRPTICAPQDYQQLIGRNIGAVTLPANLPQRIISPGDALTEDFLPYRINVFVDEKGWIARITCG